MTTINPNKAGLVLGGLLGGFHLLWAVLVAADLAQALIDFIFWLHFIRPVFMIDAFEPGRAAILVLVTASIGYAVGTVFAMLWNAVHKP